MLAMVQVKDVAKRVTQMLGVIAAVLFLLLLGSPDFISPRHHYTVRAEFQHLPTNDSILEEWLRGQAGVVSAHVARDKGEKAVRFYWTMDKNWAGNPTTPDLEEAWKRFGYAGQKNVDWNWLDK